MRIQELSLQTRHLAAQKDFYHTALGLPLLAETTAPFTLKAGATRLRFQEAQQDVLYHVAFTIPRNTFTEAKSWLHKHVSLLRKKSEDEFFFATLNARSLYFCDAANNILELIVHDDLDHETEGAFGPAQVLHVSEVGLPVEDVLAQVSLLKVSSLSSRMEAWSRRNSPSWATSMGNWWWSRSAAPGSQRKRCWLLFLPCSSR